MICESFQPLLTARLDGEISPVDRVALDAHLAECAECRARFDEMLEDDAALRGAFAGRQRAASDLADRVIATLAASSVATSHLMPSPMRERAEAAVGQTFLSAETPPASRRLLESNSERGGRSPFRRLIPFLAAAAGFALAVLLFRPWHAPPAPVVVVTPAPVAHLSLATGQVDIRPAGAKEFFACPTGGAIAPGACVRTGPKVRCELKMADGSEVRLNDQTEVTVRSPRQVELASGQVFSAVAKSPTGEQFIVRAAPADVALIALGTEFDVACTAARKQATLTVVEGSVRVDSSVAKSTDSANVIKSGEAVTLAAGTLSDRRRVYSMMAATQWVDEILVLKGRDNPELARRLNDLMAQLGHQKMQYMAAEEVRRLGDHCVVPLTRYIQSDKSNGASEISKRHAAARIIADVATTASVPELINLLAENDGEIRFQAARALERLTGQSQGRSPEQWRDQSWATCVPSVERWHAWWEQNKTKLPGCDPDAVKPLEVVKERVAPLQKG